MANRKEFSEQKIAMIIALKEGGKKTKEISDQVGVAKSTVSKWCAKFTADREKKLTVTKPRSGRPRKTSSFTLLAAMRGLVSRVRFNTFDALFEVFLAVLSVV